MYSPDRDQRLTGSDTPLAFEAKGQLMARFEQLAGASPTDHERLTDEVARLEGVLHGETVRRIEAYMALHRSQS